MTNRDRLLEMMRTAIMNAGEGECFADEQALAALRALEQNGFKVMEREPTEEMIVAINMFATISESGGQFGIQGAFEAAFDAAPAYTEGGEG